jgi:hypothetical protein
VASRAWFDGADLPWSACLVAVPDERLEPGREPSGVGEVDEVPVAGPFFDLCAGQAAEPFARDGSPSPTGAIGQTPAGWATERRFASGSNGPCRPSRLVLGSAGCDFANTEEGHRV